MLRAFLIGGLMLIAGVCVLLLLQGCSRQDIVEAQARAQEATEVLSAQKATAEAERQRADAAKAKAEADLAAAASEAERKRAEDAIADAKDAAARANSSASAATAALEALAKAQALIKESVGPDGEIDAQKATTAIGSLLPPPMQGAVGLVALGVGIWQEVRRRKAQDAAVSIINGISAVTASDPLLRAKLKSAKPILAQEYSPTAKKLVAKHKLATGVAA